MKVGIPDSKIYYALNKLSEKRMIVVREGTPNTLKVLVEKVNIMPITTPDKDLSSILN